MIIREHSPEAYKYEVRYKPIEYMPNFKLANKIVKHLLWYDSEKKEGEIYVKFLVGNKTRTATSYKNSKNRSLFNIKDGDGEIIKGGYEVVTAIIALPGTGLYNKETKTFEI